jgi:hypothetical protein
MTAFVHHLDPLVAASVSWWGDDRDAAAGGLDACNASGTKGFVAHVAKCARVSRQQIPGPTKGQESHATNWYVEAVIAAGGIRHDRTRVQPSGSCLIIP